MLFMCFDGGLIHQSRGRNNRKMASFPHPDWSAACTVGGVCSLLKNSGAQRKIILGDAKNPENGGEKARFAPRNACFALLRPNAIGFFSRLLAGR